MDTLINFNKNRNVRIKIPALYYIALLVYLLDVSIKIGRSSSGALQGLPKAKRNRLYMPNTVLGYVYKGPDRIGSNRPSVYTEPFWNRSGTDPNGSKTGSDFLQVQFWIHLDPSRIGSRMVPCKQKPIRFGSVRFGSVRNGSCPVPCQRSLKVDRFFLKLQAIQES